MRDLDIGEVAKRAGIPASTLRFYEEKGLVASVGRRGLRRQYDPEVLERLALIALGRSAGFSLEEIARMTGGRAFFAKTWQRQSEAFVSIKDELESSYTLAYYPQNNPNSGWRNIEVELVGDDMKRYRIRTRNGYRPKLSD